MPETVTQDQVVTAARDLGQAEFTREDLAQKLGTEQTEFRRGFRQARKAGHLDKVRDNDEGIGVFRVTDK